MHELQLVGFTTDRRGLIFRTTMDARAESYVVPITDQLLAVVGELASPPAPEVALADAPVPDGPGGRDPDARASEAGARAARPRSELSVREIQARLRAGESAARIAVDAGVGEEWIERFAPPIRAEQRRVVERALECHLQRSRAGASALPLRRAVGMAMAERAIGFTVPAFEAAWSSRLLGHDRWAIDFAYRHRGRARTATWVYDAAADVLTTTDRTAGQLGYVAPSAVVTADAGGAVDGVVGDSTVAAPIGSPIANRTTARRRPTGPAVAPEDGEPSAPAAAAKKQARSTRKPTRKAAAARPAAGKKAAAKKSTAQKSTAKKATAEKPTARKASVQKGSVKKGSVKKASGSRARPAENPPASGRAADGRRTVGASGAKAGAGRKAAAPGTMTVRSKGAPTSGPKVNATKKAGGIRKPVVSKAGTTSARQATTPAVNGANTAAPTAPAAQPLRPSTNGTAPPPASSAAPPAPPAPPATPHHAAAPEPTVEANRQNGSRTRPATDGRVVAPRPGAVHLADVPLAPPAEEAPRRPPALERIPDAPDVVDTTDRADARRARAAERAAPTVTFRSGSTVPVRRADGDGRPPSGRPRQLRGR